MTVLVDIKPGTRRNRVNLSSKRPLSIQMLGSEDYAAAEVDVSSLLLEAEVAPLRRRLKQRAGGHIDLKLKFSSEEVPNAFGNLQRGQTCEVWVTGKSKDGTRIMGCDSFLAAVVANIPEQEISKLRMSDRISYIEENPV